MVEDAASSNASERQSARVPSRPPFWTPVWRAWLETVEARATVEEKRDPAPSRRLARIDALARQHERFKRARRSAAPPPPAAPLRLRSPHGSD